MAGKKDSSAKAVDGDGGGVGDGGDEGAGDNADGGDGSAGVVLVLG